MSKHLILLTLLPLLLAACAPLERRGPPAPVVESQAPPPSAPPAAAPASQTAAAEPTRVYAYTPPESIQTPAQQPPRQPSSSMPTDSSEGGTAEPSQGIDASAQAAAPANDSAGGERPAPRPTTPVREPSEATPSSAATVATQPAAETPAPPAPEVTNAAAPRTSLAPADLPPAVSALAQRAEQQRQAGDSSGAAATLERALRIKPQEAYLWNRLARVRLEQGLGDSAAKLATRSNALTGDQPALKRNNWEIIATARRQAGDVQGAIEAERMANGG
jgi:hypothetical protein